MFLLLSFTKLFSFLLLHKKGSLTKALVLFQNILSIHLL
ncbi:hypothetical protein K1T44_0894 [Listeria innocua]|nr:hypothetical protein NT07LI_1157 [Listeria innocua FSL S4-378]UNB90019.1 hypothetical protein K1T44_0894 [Listeria innocua]